ncbi:hypothetical protein K1719_021499 [Acacia pycnantha]|nr:hypothetical protein K1719_021499 [Acacia pycnantha]
MVEYAVVSWKICRFSEARGFVSMSNKNNGDEEDDGIQHDDSTYFTTLQQNNVAGLEFKLKTGEWITNDPSLSLFIILAGDAFKVWSNGRITACEHKVIIREEKERYSIGLSSFNGKMVQTHEELIDEDHPRLYRAFDHYEFVAFLTTVRSQTEISKFILL